MSSPRVSPPPRDCLTAWPKGNARPGVALHIGARAKTAGAIANALTTRLERNHASIARVARAIAVSESSIHRMLAGQTWPSFWLTAELARETECYEVADILKGLITEGPRLRRRY